MDAEDVDGGSAAAAAPPPAADRPAGARPVMQSPPGAVAVLDGREYLYFGGTAYLGLQGHRDLLRAACQAMQQYGLASATSRSGLGNNPPTLQAERMAAEFFGTQDAFYYVSGYVGSMIFLQSLSDEFDRLFVDDRAHYSIADALPSAGRRVHRFAHRDAESLAHALATHLLPGQRPLVLSDGVFSASGEIAPVRDYCQVLASYAGAAIYLDDAHGAGVLGANGRGSFEHAGFPPDRVNAWTDASRGDVEAAASTADDGVRLFFSGTLSKALGGFGGIFPGTAPLIARLKTGSHFYAGASPPPVPAAAASVCALQMVMADPGLRQRLRENARALRAGLRSLGLTAEDSPVPFVGLTLGSAENMQRIERQLRSRGILLPYLSSYSGVAPQGVLRAAVSADHTPQMLRQLLDALAGLL